MANRRTTIHVTTPSGDRVRVDLEPGHTAQDVIAALIQGGRLPGEDSAGNQIRYELVDDGSLSMLPGDKPLLDLGIADGADLRIKPGARVAHEGGVR